MIPCFTVPKNIKKHNFPYKSYEEIPSNLFQEINARYQQQRRQKPQATIAVIAYNEEENVLKTLSSLSCLDLYPPCEVILIDNNSTDRTAAIGRACGVRVICESKQGVGYARQAGLEATKSPYYLCADADSIYPPTYAVEMLKRLKKKMLLLPLVTMPFCPHGGNAAHFLRSMNWVETPFHGCEQGDAPS